MAHRSPQELVEDDIAAYNAFDIAGMAALLADDIRFEHHSGDALTAEADGLAAFRQLAEASKALFSRREQRVTAWTVGADAVTVATDYSGTLARDIPGGPAAGAVIALEGCSDFAFAHGKIVRITDRS
ncbi:nuclear transport factor 2 family protein [uncultured Massilia sp.]|uniref:nuclear transport factor 2 family protein n=1 Tax=uncultured Massilia sp. TaxID=169973 RepID=UPI00258DE086|nr:nuclear transport factor 2 family protein [uncultured Massilia sp.]